MKKIALVLATLSLAFGIVYPSSAAEKDNTKSEIKIVKLQKEDVIQEIKNHYKDFAVQKKLIEKTNKGELLDSMNPEKRSLGVEEKIDEYTIQTTYPDGSQTLEGMDLSEAKFYDKNGHEISKPTKLQSLKTGSLKSGGFKTGSLKSGGFTTSGVISGGTWTSGSGYSCVTGIRVFKQIYATYSAEFKADFCNVNGGYDNISRIYGVSLTASGTFDILDSGLFRGTETISYSAYGGVKFTQKPDGGTMTTEHLYLRVGSDTYWYDSSY